MEMCPKCKAHSLQDGGQKKKEWNDLISNLYLDYLKNMKNMKNNVVGNMGLIYFYLLTN